MVQKQTNKKKTPVCLQTIDCLQDKVVWNKIKDYFSDIFSFFLRGLLEAFKDSLRCVIHLSSETLRHNGPPASAEMNVFGLAQKVLIRQF